MEGSITPQQIDIGAIISAKWGRSVPHFVVRLVERLIQASGDFSAFSGFCS